MSENLYCRTYTAYLLSGTLSSAIWGYADHFFHGDLGWFEVFGVMPLSFLLRFKASLSCSLQIHWCSGFISYFCNSTISSLFYRTSNF